MFCPPDNPHIDSAGAREADGQAANKRRPCVLIADDEPRFVRGVEINLQVCGYDVISASNGEEAIRAVAASSPDLVLLDIRMPGVDGREACRRIREISTVPIIMLTALATERDKIEALDLGADDYITKPFSAEELLARVRAALRRSTMAPQHLVERVFRAGDLLIDYTLQRVYVAGEEVDLTPIEYRLLCELIREPGKVLSSEDLLDRVWRQTGGTAPETVVWQAVHRLRMKIEHEPQRSRYILTKHGHGYYFAMPKTE